MKNNDKSQDFRASHLLFLKKMRNNGKVVAKGKFMEGSDGMVIYKVESYKE